MNTQTSAQNKWFRKAVAMPALLILISQLFSFVSYSQGSAFTASRDRLVKTLKQREISSAYTQSIDNFYNKSCDSLIKEKVTVDGRPIDVILTRLFDACSDKLKTRSITLLRIPTVNDYFLQTLKTYKKQPIKNLYREVGITQTAILESTFDGLALGDSISTFAGLREMMNAPYFISTRISRPVFLPYRDTMVYYLANNSPKILAKKLAENDPIFTSIVNNSNNMTVQAVSKIPNDTYYDKVIPFSLAILEKRTTVEDVKKLTLAPSDYFRAFVDEALRLHTNPDPQVHSFLEQPFVELNKTISNQYYISEINFLHEKPDNVRFAILEKLSPKELYFLLVGGSGELYTSSFLYLYKKFLKDAGKEGLDKFFQDIEYYQFAQFLANISGYGLVNDLVSHMRPEEFAAMIGKYFSSGANIQRTDFQIILKAMTLSEVLYEVKDNKAVADILIDKLNEAEKTKSQNDIMVQRMYAGFKDILQGKVEYKSDATYDVLAVQRLKKGNGIVQAWFFYDDEDAGSSFNNSMSTFDAATWNKKDFGNYYLFTAKSGNGMKVYMNKPNTKLGSDSAQDEMMRAIRSDGTEITSFVHRGHSYYLAQSLRKLPPSCQFVFLGSCGGYNEVLTVFLLNPDANIISTRNIGSKLINDPLLRQINTDIVNDKDVAWDPLWAQFNTRFQSSKLTKDLFASYIPPNKYVGIKFIRQVFNF